MGMHMPWSLGANRYYLSTIELKTSITVSTGIAKFNPWFPPEVDLITFTTPSNLPLSSINAPPEFPGFIDASVWIKFPFLSWKVLFIALTIPLLNDCPSPWGLPIAITDSPTLTWSMFFLILKGFRSIESIIPKTAISASKSNPKIWVLTVFPKWFSTINSWFWLKASLITWKFVTIRPFSITTPDPLGKRPVFTTRLLNLKPNSLDCSCHAFHFFISKRR